MVIRQLLPFIYSSYVQCLCLCIVPQGIVHTFEFDAVYLFSAQYAYIITLSFGCS